MASIEIITASIEVIRSSASFLARLRSPRPFRTAGRSRTLRMGALVLSLLAVVPVIAAGANPVPSNLMAEYLMQNGSGTTVADSSGNGNSATFGSTAPAWTSWGVNFNPAAGAVAQTINLPSALNSWATAVFHVCPKVGPQSTLPSGPGETWSQYQILMGSTDSSGAVLGAAYMTTSSGSGGSAGYDGFIVPQIWNQLNSATTAASDGFGACSTVAYVRDSTTDHLYVNGVETSYVRHGGSLSYAVRANYTIGSSGANQTWSGLMGNLAYAAFWSSELSAAEVVQVTSYVTSMVQARSGYPTASVNSSTGSQLIVAGDSITAGYGSTPWTPFLNLTTTYNVQNWGIGGQNVANIRIMGPVRDMTGATTSGNNTFVIYAGTNDVCSDGYSVAQAWQNISGAIQQRKGLGARVVVADIISRTGCDSTRDSLNTLIRGGWLTSGADGFVDLAASTSLGKDGAYSNTTYFQSDGTHPNATGEQVIAQLVSNAINYLDGSAASNPTVVNASSYTATWATGFLKPSANAAITLPDCQGMTGQPIQILNTDYVVTATGVNSETINGSSSAYPIPSGATTLLTPSFSGTTSGGCSWTTPSTSSSNLASMTIGSIASAAVIAPTTQIVNLTGTTTISTMTPPSGMGSTEGGCLYLIPGSAVGTSTSGNFNAAYSLTANTLYIACWNGSKWFMK